MDQATKSKFSAFAKSKASETPEPGDEKTGEDTPENTESGFYDCAERLCTAMGVEDADKHAAVASVLMDLKDHFLKGSEEEEG